ncbi:MAG: HAD hydrolase-like protein [Pelobium sp.]
MDLDDTIFETKSMDSKLFDPFFDHLINILKEEIDLKTIERITHDLWQIPIDKVIDKYGLSIEKIHQSLCVLENLELKLEVKVYEDYPVLKSINLPMFLVTTGLKTLQQSKIASLGIENDFVEIVINDPIKDKRSKKDVFKDLAIRYDLKNEHIYIIGDNPDSEIKDGNNLGMVTIQIFRNGKIEFNQAQFAITSFDSLKTIIL